MKITPPPRCEQTLFNAPGEALALTDAARLFLASEQETRALQAPGFDEHLQAALNCYSFAIKVKSPACSVFLFSCFIFKQSLKTDTLEFLSFSTRDEKKRFQCFYKAIPYCFTGLY